MMDDYLTTLHLTDCAHEKNACDKVFCVHSAVACKGIAISCQRNAHIWKIVAHSMMKSPNPTVHQPPNVRHQDDEEEELVVVAGNNISILFLNQHDQKHLHVVRIVVLVFVEFDFEDVFLC